MSAPTPEDSPANPDEAVDTPSREGGPFDLARLRELVEMMEKHGLTEVSLKNEETQWKLRRGPEIATGFPPVAPQFLTTPSGAAPQPAASAPPQASAAAAQAHEGLVIKSPTVGTFYSASSPDDPPLVTIGSKVELDTVVCLVEAMKVFNQIPAEVSGIIAEALVNNGDSVEFGQPLFRVRPG